MITKEPFKHDHNLEYHFSAAARIGFLKILQSIDFGDSGCILLPAYIGITDREGSGVFDPIQSIEIEYDFYTLNQRLEADLQDITDKIRNLDVRAILVIHYFGFPQPGLEEISKLCLDKDIILIEDCAHSISSKTISGNYLGTVGEFSFHSIHKYLPTEDGGYFKVKSLDAPRFILNKKEKISIDSLIIYAKADFQKIETIRRDNYQYMVQQLQNIEGIKIMYPKLDGGTVPLNFPILIKKGKRENLYFELLDLGIPTIALYYRLIPQIEPELFPISYEVSRDILNLSIHQDVDHNDIDSMVETFKKALAKI